MTHLDIDILEGSVFSNTALVWHYGVYKQRLFYFPVSGQQYILYVSRACNNYDNGFPMRSYSFLSVHSKSTQRYHFIETICVMLWTCPVYAGKILQKLVVPTPNAMWAWNWSAIIRFCKSAYSKFIVATSCHVFVSACLIVPTKEPLKLVL